MPTTAFGIGSPVSVSVTTPVNAPVQMGTSPKFTVSDACVLWLMPPPVAVIVNDCNAAAGASAAPSTYMVTTPDGVIVAGLNDAVTPLGSPLALSWTSSSKRLTDAMLSVIVDRPPGARYCEVATRAG